MSQIPHPSTLTRLTTPPSLPKNAENTLEIIGFLESSADPEENSLNDRLQQALIRGLMNIQDDRMGNRKFFEIEAIQIAPTAAYSTEANATTATWATLYRKQFKPINRWQTERCEQLNTKIESLFSNLTLEQRLERLGSANSPHVIYSRGNYDSEDDGNSQDEGNSLSGAGTSPLPECNDPPLVCIESGKNQGPIFQAACSPADRADKLNGSPKNLTFHPSVTIRTESPLNDQSYAALKDYRDSSKEVAADNGEFLVDYTTTEEAVDNWVQIQSSTTEANNGLQVESETSERGPKKSIISFFKRLFGP